jgi:hypothetical protein
MRDFSRMMAGRRRWEEPAEPFFQPSLVYRSVWGHQILASCDRQQTHTVVVFLLLPPRDATQPGVIQPSRLAAFVRARTPLHSARRGAQQNTRNRKGRR